MNEVKELEHDFRNALEDVDFSGYSPYSKEYMKALFIGQMWDLVNKLHNNKEDDIQEEFDGAKKYLGLYKSTNDAAYKEMASDELRHAGILIKKRMSKASTQEEKDKLSAFEAEKNKWMATVSAA